MTTERASKVDFFIQVTQTLLLALVIAVGGWNLKTTAETQNRVATLVETMNLRSRQIDGMEAEIKDLHTADNLLDRRVTTLEATKRIQ